MKLPDGTELEAVSDAETLRGWLSSQFGVVTDGPLRLAIFRRIQDIEQPIRIDCVRRVRDEIVYSYTVSGESGPKFYRSKSWDKAEAERRFAAHCKRKHAKSAKISR